MFESRLKKLRLEYGKTQSELANALGITYQAYAHYEKGRRAPSPDQLIKLADYFNISVDYLIGHNETVKERAEEITSIEHEMLGVFREIGKKHGEEAQRAYITVGEKML